VNFEDSYVVFDFECTIRCPIGTHKANPHWPGNYAVMMAARNTLSAPSIPTDWAHNTTHTDNHIWPYFEDTFEARQILVGHNLSFDLQWLMRESKGAIVLKNKTLWDTAIAEYVLTGQLSKWPSLNSLCVKYGLPVKDDRIATMWAAGTDTDAIPFEMLREYCCRDVENTEKIFLLQLAEAKAKGCLPLILVLNDALLATTEMMWNGMKVDATTLATACETYKKRIDHIEHVVKYGVNARYKFPDINLNSPKQLSSLLYGGTETHVTKEPNGEYKTGPKKGETKYKTVEHEIKFPGYYKEEEIKLLKIEKTTHGYSTSDEALQKLDKAKCPYLDYLINHRELDKQYNTYLLKTKELLFPDNVIYHNINNTATSTGRYSSSEPNLQNVTSGETSDIKQCYVSRFKNGSIIEADFAQLEMVALAQLSRDGQLIDDINTGVDIHSELFESLFMRLPSKEERKKFKRASFALIYGAGPAKIAAAVGITLAEAKSFIRAWHFRYPDTVAYWNDMVARAEANRQMGYGRDKETGTPLGSATLQMPTGRLLTFVESVAPWNGKVGFSPNELKNYPVQSFATGDIVPLFIGKLVRALLSHPQRERMLLVNTVHDSVVLDVAPDAVEECVKVLKNTFDNMPLYIQEVFGIELVVDLKAGISKGPNWAVQEEVK
jgi:DNA polymerase-1